MAGTKQNPPDPLLTFDGFAGELSESIGRVDAALTEFRTLKDAGRILPNSVEALRVELTYHSNAIEGSTLSLRETQLVIEGHAPTSGKTLREIYEARNHDRALRTIEGWAEQRVGGWGGKGGAPDGARPARRSRAHACRHRPQVCGKIPKRSCAH